MLRTGLVSVSFRKLPVAEVLCLVTDAGLDGIEWGGDVHVPPADAPRARQVAQMTKDAGVTIAAYGSYYRLGVQEQASFESILETALLLNAPTIRVWAGTKNSADAADEDWSRVVEDAQRIAGLAAQARVSVSFEFHDLTLNNNATGTARLMQSIRMENVCTLWQPPVDATQDACLTCLRSVLPWLGNVHVFNWRPAYTRLSLSEGAADWMQYIDAIRSTGRDHFLMLEFVRDDLPSAFLEDAQTLKSWLLEKQETKQD